jgi:hypothetical protein
MAANTSPIFTLTPNIGMAEVAAANTESDGTGDLVLLFTAGAEGSRVDRIRYQNAQSAAAASSAMVAKFFITDTGGANPRLLVEVAIGAITRTVAVVGANGIYTFVNGLIIPSGTLLKVCQSVYAGVQDLMHYVCEGGDF